MPECQHHLWLSHQWGREAKVRSLQCCFFSEAIEVSTPQATNHALILISNPRENGKPHKIQFGAIILLEEEIAPKNLLKILQEFECESYFGSLLNFLILINCGCVRMSLFIGKHGGKMMVMGQNVELVNLGKGYMGIPCSVLFLQRSSNFEIISKLKVTPNVNNVSFFSYCIFIYLAAPGPSCSTGDLQSLSATFRIFFFHAGSFSWRAGSLVTAFELLVAAHRIWFPDQGSNLGPPCIGSIGS